MDQRMGQAGSRPGGQAAGHGTPDGPITTIAYASWQEFKRDLFLELYPGGGFVRGQYLFRGEGSADWRLVSLFDRQFADVPLTRRMELWDRLTLEWRAECLDAGISPGLTGDDAALWALGQHHGLPTRLLDWSLSPYIAAFFAFRMHLVSSPMSQEQVAVWVLHTASPIWAGPGVQVVAPPAPQNARLRSQGGRFTLCRAAVTCLEDHVQRMTTEPSLTRCLLPASSARTALGELDAMGITDHDLFPDLTGLASRATMRAALAVLAQ